MLKKVLFALLFVLPFTVSAQAQTKIGKVDFAALVSALPEHAEAQKKFEETTKAFEADFVRIRDEYTEKAQKLEADYDSIPEAVRNRRIQELQEAGQRVEQYRTDITQQLQKKESELMQPIVEKVNAAIKTVGEEGNFTCIFDVNATQGLLFTGKDCEDVTPKVKTKLGLK